MKIIYPKIGEGNAIIRHDEIELFSDTEIVSHLGKTYVIEDYTGSKPVDSDITLDEYLFATESKLIPIVVNSVTPNEPDYDDSDNEYTVNQQLDIAITSPLDWPDGKLRIPAVRTDTGRTIPIVGTVKNKVLTIIANFPTAGYWVCGNEQINSAFKEPVFDMQTIKFTVI